jgi:hypothetical protein
LGDEMKKIIMVIGQISIVPLFPLYGLWMCFHHKSFEIVTEWYFWGCRYEDSDFHREIEEIIRKRNEKNRK